MYLLIGLYDKIKPIKSRYKSCYKTRVIKVMKRTKEFLSMSLIPRGEGLSEAVIKKRITNCMYMAK